MITQEKLKEQLSYNKNNGKFIWIKSKKGISKNSIAGSMHKDGCILIGIDNKIYKAHRLAWLYIYGYMPKEIDHINHDRADNRIFNLREVKHSDNMKNLPLAKNNKSGITGVRWCRIRLKYVAYIQVDKKPIPLGRYDNKTDAIKARKDAEIKYNFHKNHGK